MKPAHAFRSHPLLTGFALLILLLVLAFGLCEWRGWPFLREPLQRTISSHLDRDVELGEGFSLHLLGALKLRTNRLVIGPPRWDDKPGDRFFAAQDVYLELPWSTAWRVARGRQGEPLHVSALDVGSFDATLWRRPDGHANWEFQLPKKPGAQPGSLPEFDRLSVRNGRLSLEDAPTTVSLRAQATTEEGSVPGGPAGQGAGLRIQGDGRYRQGQFNFTMHSGGVLPLIAPEGSQLSVPITLQGKTPEGRLSFEGQARDVIHLKSLQGRFHIDGSSLAAVAEPFGVTLPTTAAFDAEGTLGKDGNVYRAGVARFEVGSSRLAGDFTFDRRPEVPMLTGVLRGSRLDLKDLGPAFGAHAKGAPNPPAPSGKVFPDRDFDIPSLARMNADVRVELGMLDLHTSVLKPLEPVRGRVQLRDAVLRIDPLLAHTSGGEIQGRLGLDGRKPKRPLWSGDLKVSGVQLEDWIKVTDTHAKPQSTNASGKVAATKYVSGRLGGHVQFTGGGRSVADMLGSLDGTIAAWVNDGRVSHLALEAAGIDIAQAIGVLVKGDDALPMQCAVAQFSARDGLLHTDVGIIDTSDTTLLFNGDISLAKEQFALVAQANPKDFSPAALRTPIHLDGPFVKPHVHVETKPIAVKAVAALALGAVNPLAALIPLVDPGHKSPVGCQQALQNLRSTHGVEPPKVQAAGTSRAFADRVRQRPAGKAPVEGGPAAQPPGPRH